MVDIHFAGLSFGLNMVPSSVLHPEPSITEPLVEQFFMNFNLIFGSAWSFFVNTTAGILDVNYEQIIAGAL